MYVCRQDHLFIYLTRTTSLRGAHDRILTRFLQHEATAVGELLALPGLVTPSIPINIE